MATPVPNYYADTSINGEVIGEQEIRLFPLVNSVISSEPLVLISNAAAIPISKSYYLSYDNNELGPVFNKDNIKRNEILNINITPFIYQTASKLVSKYYLPYDNGEIGPVSDKSGVYRNEILTLNNQDAYRYLVQDSSGSNYPTGSGNQYSITSSLSTSSSLVLYLNAFVSSSYGGTGSNWYDLSGTYTSASIVNGSTFFTGSTTQSINAVVLNGTNQYIQAPSGFADFTNGLTCICLCNFGNVGTWERIMDFGNGSANNNIGFSRYSTNNSLRFFIYNGSSNVLEVGSNNIIDNNAYAVYTIRLSGSMYDFYKNGVLDSSGATTVRPPNITRTSNFIGRSNWPDAYWDNGIGIFALWNKGLSNSELSSSHDEILTYYRRILNRYDGEFYNNSNILNIRFVTGSISASNLILPTRSNYITASQDILVTNISKSVDNYLINVISTGSNLIKRNDGIVDKTVYTGDSYLSSTDIIAVGSVNNLINTISSGSNLIKGTDGMVNNTVYTGDSYLSDTTINTEGLIKRTILRGSNTTITTNTSEFIPTVNKTYTYEVDYNYMFNQEIDSVLTIDTAYDLPTGFNISTNGKNIVGYVNFTDTKTVIVKLSDGTIYNIIIKPIFFKKKYIY